MEIKIGSEDSENDVYYMLKADFIRRGLVEESAHHCAVTLVLASRLGTVNYTVGDRKVDLEFVDDNEFEKLEKMKKLVDAMHDLGGLSDNSYADMLTELKKTLNHLKSKDI